ncbi:hypothetical protein Ddye_023872 [Dipteronia dyeriana]|uniref:Uncharacterized protein n=1 Tax=Dipteronia dyeriana TaxID=168575 RepID=A0AAD9TUP5_9ROSI|nr:hypothetical protein Ddye_023872 [Dipteronia dyeriana]
MTPAHPQKPQTIRNQTSPQKPTRQQVIITWALKSRFRFWQKKYSKPVPTIAYFDTSAHTTMMNPRVLPPEAWKEKSNEFLTVDDQIFITNLVYKKKIGIQFFPSYTLWTHVIGTPFPDKDILIG